MKALESRQAIRSVANSAVLAFLGAIVMALELFPSLRTWMQSQLVRIGVSSGLVNDVVLVFLVGTALFLILLPIALLLGTRGTHMLRTPQASLVSVVSPGSSGERIRDFQLLRAQARHSILVMGVGMTNFSTDRAYLRELLDRGLTIRLLMIDPYLIRPNATLAQAINVDESSFDELYARPGYALEVRASCERLRRFVEERKALSGVPGEVELRTYPFLAFMNVTVIDADTSERRGKMILEMFPPYAESRMRVTVTEADDRDMFQRLQQDINQLWEKSVIVSTSRHAQ